MPINRHLVVLALLVTMFGTAAQLCGQGDQDTREAFLREHQVNAIAHASSRSAHPQFVYSVLTARSLRHQFPDGEDAVAIRNISTTISDAFSKFGDRDRRRWRGIRRQVLDDVVEATSQRIPSSSHMEASDVRKALVDAYLTVDRIVVNNLTTIDAATYLHSDEDPARKVFTVDFARSLLSDSDDHAKDILRAESEKWTDLKKSDSRSLSEFMRHNPRYAKTEFAKSLEYVRTIAADGLSDDDLIQIGCSIAYPQRGASESGASESGTSESGAAGSSTSTKDGKKANQNEPWAKYFNEERRQKLRNLVTSLGQLSEQIDGDVGVALSRIAQTVAVGESLGYLAASGFTDPSAYISLTANVLALFSGGRPDPMAIVLQQMHQRFDEVVARFIALELKLDLYMHKLISAANMILTNQDNIRQQLLSLRAYVAQMRHDLVGRLAGIERKLERMRNHDHRAKFQESVLDFVVEGRTPSRSEHRLALTCLYEHAVNHSTEDGLIGNPIGLWTHRDYQVLPLAGPRHEEDHESVASAPPEPRRDFRAFGWRRSSDLLWFNTLRLSHWPVDASIDRVHRLWDLTVDAPTSSHDRCPDLDAFCLAVQRYEKFAETFPDMHDDPGQPSLVSPDKIARMQEAAEYCYQMVDLTRDPTRWQKLLDKHDEQYLECIALLESLTSRFAKDKLRLSEHEKAIHWPFSPAELARHFSDPPNTVTYEQRRLVYNLWSTLKDRKQIEKAVKDWEYKANLDAIYPSSLHILEKGTPQSQISLVGDRKVKLVFQPKFIETIETRSFAKQRLPLPATATKGLPHWVLALSHVRSKNERSENVRPPLDLEWSGVAYFSPAVKSRDYGSGTWFNYRAYTFWGRPNIKIDVKLRGKSLANGADTVARCYADRLTGDLFQYKDQLNYIAGLRGPKKYNGRSRASIKDQAAKSLPNPAKVLTDDWHEKVVKANATVQRSDVRAANSNTQMQILFEECRQREAEFLELLAAACDVDRVSDELFERELESSLLNLTLRDGSKLQTDLFLLRNKVKHLSATSRLIAYALENYGPDLQAKRQASNVAALVREKLEKSVKTQADQADDSLAILPGQIRAFPGSLDLVAILQLNDAVSFRDVSTLLRFDDRVGMLRSGLYQTSRRNTPDIVVPETRLTVLFSLLRAWRDSPQTDFGDLRHDIIAELTTDHENRNRVESKRQKADTKFRSALVRYENAQRELETSHGLVGGDTQNAPSEGKLASQIDKATTEFLEAKAALDQAVAAIQQSTNKVDMLNAELPLFQRVLNTKRRLEKLKIVQEGRIALRRELK